jgi:hypothetical protein
MLPAKNYLILHGSIMLLSGMLMSIPYALLTSQGASAVIINSWRVGYRGTTLCAAVMLAVGALLPALNMLPEFASATSILFIAFGYCFLISAILASSIAHAGRYKDCFPLKDLVHLANAGCVITSVSGALLLCIAAFKSI